MNKTVKLNANKIIISVEVAEKKRGEILKAFLEDKAKATALGAFSYELAGEGLRVEWKDILEEIEKIIDLRSDSVFLWRFDPEKGELLRTKISGQ